MNIFNDCVRSSTFALMLCSQVPAMVHAEESEAELAKKSLNPVAAMYSLPFQFNWNENMGPTGDGIQSYINIQPVIPITLNDDWNLISRTILPVIDQHGLAPSGTADASGIGDITQSLFFSPVKPTADGWIWGVGPALLIPTGSDELLSSEQPALGPTVVLLKQQSGWTVGFLGNHLWTLDNTPPDDKPKVNATFLQPFLSYTTKTYTSFGINTESTYDWTAHEWAVPINLFVSQILKVGGQPMSLQFGPRYWAESSQYGASEWGWRASFTLLFPK